MIIGIDASNIRNGGGVTHLVKLLCAADPVAHGFSQILVWSGQSTLDRIENRSWLVKSHEPLLDETLPCRVFWQRFRLSRLARSSGCDILFVPGGSYAGDFRPMVTMSRNLLPFEWPELLRYGWSWMTLKLLVLRLTQSRTFRRANGIIFLTRYAQDAVMRLIKTTCAKTTIIPHGIDDQFVCPPSKQLSITQYTADNPFRILYVSIIDLYKHQWHVAEAVAQLIKSGLPVSLALVGSAYPPALKRLRQKLDKIDPAGESVWYTGEVPYAELHLRYAQADLCLFASSCENMPNILLEGMASGLPIACSNRGPMPQILGNAGVYFDPEKPNDILRAIRTLITSPDLRTRLAQLSFERVQVYSWRRCADETFGFLVRVACDYKIRRGLCASYRDTEAGAVL
ncbi:MAG: glycosyltransferase family 1 protein [Desulfobacteraceae bacterium]|nr:MAG: glycosyltransferase family 1 protein [Desulfobacteraceae bacterium]